MNFLHFTFEKYDLTFEMSVKYTININQSSGIQSHIGINIACEPIACIHAYDSADNKIQEAEVNEVMQRDNLEIVRKAHRLILEKVEI